MTKVKMVCAVCGSTDVTADAWAYWDVETQEWLLHSTFDDKFCHTCEDSVNLKEVPIEEENPCPPPTD